ncbi:MAG: DUF1987 domain-containing protein [Bacteroidales bacterium]|nr:DUF1987 domain-containing protein [Bacteroidales bacterium]
MEDLFIQGADSLPTISFKTDGELKITGRALPEDAAKFFEPVMEWLGKFSADEINLEVNLDYFNTSVSKKLLDIFKVIEDNPDNKAIKVLWKYEDGDDEMLESGQIYEELLPRLCFTFHKYAEMAGEF